MIISQNTKMYNNIMEREIWALDDAEVHHFVAGHPGLKRNRPGGISASFISHISLLYSLENIIIKTA